MMGFPRTSRTPEGIPIGGIRQWRTGFYVQDDWRATPRLTVNLGLRYDHNFAPKDINGVSRTLRFDLDPSGPVLWPGPGEVVDQLYFNEHRHWAPRLGFAYQLSNQLVVRGGYGVFNMALHLDNINTLGTNPPTASVQVTNPTTNPQATIAFPFPPALVLPTRSSTSPRRRSIAITRMATTRTGTSRSATSCPVQLSSRSATSARKGRTWIRA